MGKSSRTIMDVADNWEFIPRRSGRSWLSGSASGESERVDLPHSWNRMDTFEEGVVYRQGWGSYRKTFPGFQAREVLENCLLSFGGFYGTGDIWVNGRRRARVDGRYLGAQVAIDDPHKPFTVGVRLTNRYAPHVLPGIRFPDFLLYGGLAGQAQLLFRSPLHFDTDRCFVDYAGLDRGELALHWRVRNDGPLSRHVTAFCRVETLQGETVIPETDMTSSACEPDRFLFGCKSLDASGFCRWSPDAPVLYRAVFVLRAEGLELDSHAVTFGVRTIEFRKREGFFLNGERLPLRGCNRHESMPGFGNALPEALHRKDARLLKDLGFNFVRLSHYPQHPSFLDACDELGILVYAEIASWKSVRTGRWLASAERQLADMIARDRNHPSVMVWGVGNEGRSRPAFRRLMTLARTLDPSRPVSYAENHLYRARRKRTLHMPDVWGLNYEFSAISRAIKASRTSTVIVTECANEPETERGQTALELRQVNTIRTALDRIADQPAVAGYALWCFNDYATMRKNRYRRFSGVVDAWRQPKLAAYFHEARHASRPVLRLVADWSETSTEEERTLHVFSNCDAVTVRVNDRKIGDYGYAGGYTAVTVPFEPGRLTVEGIGAYGDMETRLDSYGAPDALVLEEEILPPDSSQSRLVCVNVRVVDAEKKEVPTYNGAVRAELKGGGRLMLHQDYGLIPVARGAGVIYLEISDSNEQTVLRVEAADLAPAEFTPGPYGAEDKGDNE